MCSATATRPRAWPLWARRPASRRRCWASPLSAAPGGTWTLPRGTACASADLYITNAVKFRPVRTAPNGRTGNRPPTREEAALFLPWLKKELALVSPALIVTLGNVPLRALTGRSLPIGRVHGQALEGEDGQPLFALYHPASVLYNPALRATYAQDLAQLRQKLQLMRLI